MSEIPATFARRSVLSGWKDTNLDPEPASHDPCLRPLPGTPRAGRSGGIVPALPPGPGPEPGACGGTRHHAAGRFHSADDHRTGALVSPTRNPGVDRPG